MFALLGWVLVGYLAGSVALWLVPPKRELPGWQTIAFGVAGSIVGGMVSATINADTYSPAGIMWSVIGAVAVVAAWRWYEELP